MQTSKTGVRFILLFLPGILFFSSCTTKQKADLIIYNAKVYTVDSAFTTAEAFAVFNGKILATGTSNDILKGFEAKEKIDENGRPVYPGFIDAHCHFFGYASDMMKADLYGTKSFNEVVTRVFYFSKTNKFGWILGRGWDQNHWAVKQFPSKDTLDKLFPAIPVYLVRVDGHAVLCNQTALDHAGITSNTKVDGGEVEVKNGKLTGILIDNAVDLVRKLIPPFTEENNKQALLGAQHNCFAVGLTTVDDAGLAKDTIAFLDRLQKRGQLKIRIYAMISDDERTRKYYFKHGHYKTDRLNVRSIKMYADGALGSRGACLLQPYSDSTGHYGFLLNSVDYFEKIAGEALQHNFQVCTHAIGDSANRVMLNVYAKCLQGKNDKRWRIEHCQVVDPNDIKKFGEYNIIPSVQPTHATSDMYWAENRLGKNRIASAYAYKDLMKQNSLIAFGTDFPVEDINPLYTFYAAVARKDLKGFPAGGFQPENAVSRQDALRGMTIWAAYSNFEESEKGSIEKGKLADFVILEQDIMQADIDSVPHIKVWATYINGEKVFSVK